MTRNFVQCFLSIAVSLVFGTSILQTRADDLTLFISAFAAGDKGAIHAFQFDLDRGDLKQTHRTTDVEHPFFMALSPDKKYLYSIHAQQFGGNENENVAAYKIVEKTGQLKLLNRQSALGTAACYLDVDAAGRRSSSPTTQQEAWRRFR